MADQQIVTLTELKSAYSVLLAIRTNYELSTRGERVLKEALEIVAREVCEQHGYSAMVEMFDDLSL